MKYFTILLVVLASSVSCVSAVSDTETVSTIVKVGKYTFRCKFTLVSNGAAVLLNDSNVTCKGKTAGAKRKMSVTDFAVSTDKAEYKLSFQINPTKLTSATIGVTTTHQPSTTARSTTISTTTSATSINNIKDKQNAATTTTTTSSTTTTTPPTTTTTTATTTTTGTGQTTSTPEAQKPVNINAQFCEDYCPAITTLSTTSPTRSSTTTTTTTANSNNATATCCESVTLSSTNTAFLSSNYWGLAGRYSKYTDNPTVNDRMVYKLDWVTQSDFCLFYAVGRWAISDCSYVGDAYYRVKSADTLETCVDGVENWEWQTGSDTTPDPTMTVLCSGPTTTTTPTPSTTTTTTTTTTSTTEMTTTEPGTPESVTPESCIDVTEEKIQLYLNQEHGNKTDTAEECRGMCQSHMDCMSWSWSVKDGVCLLKGELSDEVTHISGSRHCEKENILLHTGGGYEYYKIPVARGTNLLEGAVPDTCDGAQMRAVCNGPSGCKWNSDRCLVTPVSSVCGDGNFVEISNIICNEDDPLNCPQLQGVFGYSKGWTDGECGVVNGSYCAPGKDYWSGDPQYYAFCAKCESGSCKINGGWSQWSSWSSCGSECTRSRSRTCSDPEPSNGGSDCKGRSKVEESCSSSCTGVPPYNPELAPPYNPTRDGGAVFVGGFLEPLLSDMASESSETIEVRCCSAGTLSTIVHKCGNGTSCDNICGDNDSGCITVVGSSDATEQEVCSASMEGEDWCRDTSVIEEITNSTCSVGGRRKKRATNPSWILTVRIMDLWYCPGMIKDVTSLKTETRSYKECCLHPTVRQTVTELIEYCCREFHACF